MSLHLLWQFNWSCTKDFLEGGENLDSWCWSAPKRHKKEYWNCLQSQWDLFLMAQRVEIYQYGGEGIRTLGTKNVVRVKAFLLHRSIYCCHCHYLKKEALIWFYWYVKNNHRVICGFFHIFPPRCLDWDTWNCYQGLIHKDTFPAFY